VILFMATFTAPNGFGVGTGPVTPIISVSRARTPHYAAIITFTNLGLAFALVVVVIAAISGDFGVRRVLGFEPCDIFGG
jgi:putative ABC transport system permease protein